MSLILLINTFEKASSVALAENAQLLASFQSEESQSFHLHASIRSLFEKIGKEISSMDAVAVIDGPGSYTGLRVGMAAAKGLCYTLKKPLITLSSLEVMAKNCLLKNQDAAIEWFGPMIDARREEVFCAIYDRSLRNILEPAARILTPDSFTDLVKNRSILFSGSGAEKWGRISSYPVLTDFTQENLSEAFASLADHKFKLGNTAAMITAEPNYLKDFHSQA